MAGQHEHWHILNRRLLADGSPWVRLWQETVELPGGRIVDDYHMVEMPGFAIVIAFTRDGRVVAERFYRHGPGREVLTLPGGHLEPLEDPATTARRELLEETGYGGGDWHALGAYVLSESNQCGYMHVFMALDVEPMAKPENDDLEPAEIDLLSPEQFMAALWRGEVASVPAMSGFLLAQAALNRLGGDTA